MADSNSPHPPRHLHGRKRLPVNPSAEHLRKQAKRRSKSEGLQLSEAQQNLATEYGCRNWAELMRMVENMGRNATKLIGNGNSRFEPLPTVVRQRDLEAVQRILKSGEFTPHDLDAGLAHAAWYGGNSPSVLKVRKQIFDLLLEFGADPDGQYGSNYGPIVFGCGECLSLEGLTWLIEAGCDVSFPPVNTKYGKQCALSYVLGTYARGNNTTKHRMIDLLLKSGAFIPSEVTPALLAVHRGDVNELGRLIDATSSLTRQTFHEMPYGNMLLAGGTLLHSAVEFNEVECIDLLLDRGADINARAEVIDGIGGQTPIFHLIATNQDDDSTLQHLVKRLGRQIDTKIAATFRLSNGEKLTQSVTPLEYGVISADPKRESWQRARPQVVSLLLEAGADPNQRGTDGETLLCRAAETGPVEVVESLLRHGARNWIADGHSKLAIDRAREGTAKDKDRIITLLNDVRILDPDFRAAVNAIDSGDEAELKVLLRRRPELVRMRAEEEGWYAGPYFRHPTLLHFIAQNPHRGSRKVPSNICDIAQAIINAGADVSATTEGNQGSSTLALVASCSIIREQGLQIPLIELLVKNGAIPDEGMDAAISQHETIAANALLQLGAKLTLLSAAALGQIVELKHLLSQQSPVAARLAAAQAATAYGQVDALRLLLDHGLDVNARLPHPYSPTLLHQAAWYGHLLLVNELLSRGADPSLRDSQFQGTPEDWARHNGHSEIAEILKSQQ